MFSVLPISIAFVLFNVLILSIDGMSKPESKFYQHTKKIAGVLLVASVYLLFAGIFLASGWDDPFFNADKSEIAQAGAKAGRGGFILFIIQFWPYAMMLLATSGVVSSIKSINGRRS